MVQGFLGQDSPGYGSSRSDFRKCFRKVLIAALLATTAVVGNSAVLQSQALAQAQTSFNIPAGPLNRVLAAFGKQSGIQISYEASIASGKTSPGIQGATTREQAIARILQGSGLIYSFKDARNVLITQPRGQTTGGAMPAGAIVLDTIDVQGASNPNSTMTPTPAYAGGQVASGGRVGFLGNRSVFDTPFTQNNYTEKLIRDQQARGILDVLDNNPAVRAVSSPFTFQQNIFIRGFLLNARALAFDGLYGIVPSFRPAIEGAERIEVLNGPAALLYGFPPDGNVAGVVNLIPKRAPDAPLTRLTGQYLSNGTFNGQVDLARRFGPASEWGVRFNGAHREGATPIDRNNERLDTLTIGLDYRGERLRFSVDFGAQQFSSRSGLQSFRVLPGFAIPQTQPLTSNVQQPWERFQTTPVFTVGRAEYDLADNVTVFGAIGGSKLDQDRIASNPTITNPNGSLSLGPNRQLSFQEQWTGETGVRARFATGFIDHSAAVVGTHYESDNRTGFAQAPAFASNLYNPVFVPPPLFPSDSNLAQTLSTAKLDGIAVTDTMSAFDGRVQVIAGGRFQRAQNSTIASGVSEFYDKSAATPMAAAIVKPVENLSLYASYAEGFGFGPQAPLGANNPGQIFPPIITKQIETGAKLDLGTLGATVAFYEIAQPSGFLNPVTNIFGLNGEQRNRGVDLNVFGEPTPGFRLLGGVSLLDGRLTKTAGGTFDGRVAPGVPDMQLNLGGEIDMPWLAPGLTLNGRVIYTSAQFYDQANTQSIPDWTRLDLGARYSFIANGTPLVARFNVLNVTGANYWASTGQGALHLGTPRTFLFSISADLTPAPAPLTRSTSWTK
jgi:iron complex outermembrane receptor protein